MKFEITETQINEILKGLQEVPAKFVFNAMQTLTSLPQIEEKKED